MTMDELKRDELRKLFEDLGIEKVNDKPIPESTLIEKSPLTPHQQEVMEGIIDALERGVKKIVLKGSAGTGKTFLVQYLIKEYRKIKNVGKVAITAPTNRAVSVLMEKQKSPPYYMEFTTIHKALFLKRFINGKTGEITFKPDYNPAKQKPFQNCSLVIVDEASMLNSQLLYDMEAPDYANVPMVFLGDPKQLPPVNEDSSPVFSRASLSGTVIKLNFVGRGEEINHLVPQYEEFELTEIIRQGAGNPIIDLSYNLSRISLLENNLTENDEGYVYTSDLQECIDIIKSDENGVRYLAWTNAEVNAINTEVRRQIFGVPNKVELGETIIFIDPYEGVNTNYYTSYELKIESLEIKTTMFRPIVRFKYDDDGPQEITLERELTYYWVNKEIKIIHENSMDEFLDLIRQIKHMTKFGLSWKAFYGFSEEFAKFGYRYALTVHKSQGGTFNKVIINMKNLNLNKKVNEKNSLWYTALTRAAKKAYIFNAPYNERA